MALRDGLIVQKPEDAHVLRITELIESIIAAVHAQNDCRSKLADLRKLTGLNELDEDYFRTLHSHSSVEECVAKAALPRAPRVGDLSNAELVEITKRAMDVLSWDAEYYMELLDKNTPLPDASNLIFNPPDHYEGDIFEYEPTAEQIVSWATLEKKRHH